MEYEEIDQLHDAQHELLCQLDRKYAGIRLMHSKHIKRIRSEEALAEYHTHLQGLMAIYELHTEPCFEWRAK